MKQVLGKMYININGGQKILLIAITFLIFTFSTKTDCKKTSIEVTKIDSTSIKNTYLVFFITKNNQGILYSKMKPMNTDTSCKSIMVGSKYWIKLNKVFRVDLGDNILFPLYRNSIYLDGKVIFKKEDNVFSSADVDGLCLKE